MKKITILTIFIILFAFVVSAQTEQNADCPTLSIRGGGVYRTGETTHFTADIDKKEKELKIEYVWSVESGEIIKGQGTETIEVKVSNYLRASVEIRGFPVGCANTASESSGCGLRNEPIKLDEFSNLELPTIRTKLKDMGNVFRNNPYSQIYVIAKFKKNTSKIKISQKIKKIEKILMSAFSVDANRITIFQTFFLKESTEIWIVPPGAENPQIERY